MRGEEALKRLEAARRERREALSLQRRLNETVRLERGRGETIERPARGPLIASSRDGLKAMHSAGSLDDAQFEAGLTYRRCYEALGRGSSSCLERIMVGGGGTSEAWAERRARLAAKLARMEAKAPPGRAGAALRLVAGEGRCVRHFARGGADRAKYAQALGEILDVLARDLGLKA